MNGTVQYLKVVVSVSMTVLILCLSPTASLAQESQSGVLYDPCRVTVEIAPEISWIRYVEPDMMSEEGFMYGVSGSIIYHGHLFSKSEKAESWMLRGDGRHSWGEVDYRGALMDGTPYEMHNIEDEMMEFRGLIGLDVWNRVARTTPYTGFGYRYLNDDSSFDPAGYEREANYFYVPIGFEIGFPSESEWSFGATIELDILAWGKQKSHLGGTYGTIENRQDEGRGFRASLRFQKNQPGLDFAFEPFCRLWNISDSDVSDGFIEPENSSTEVGLRLVWAF
jgi:hypothetical protein